MAHLRDALQGPDSTEALEAARELIERVVISPPLRDHDPSGIEVVGDFVTMLQAGGLGPDTKHKRAPNMDVLRLFASSVKVDSGACFMRRTARFGLMLGTALALSGCVGFGDFLENTSTYGTNPNKPMGDSLNMRRVQGQQAEAAPIMPQPGNVWPRGVDPLPTLMQDMDSAPPMRPAGNPRTSQSGAQPTPMAAIPPASTAQGATQAGTQTMPPDPPQSPLAAADLPPQTVIPTASGPASVNARTDRYQTVATPAGTAVLVPNGNGTATLMRADGTMETVPAPR